jgi:integrase
MRIPTMSQVGLLLAHADSTRVSTRHGLRAYVALCAFAGLRKGEAAAVQVGDIDLEPRQLTVSRQLQRDADTFAIRLPKYGSERVVHLPHDFGGDAALSLLDPQDRAQRSRTPRPIRARACRHRGYSTPHLTCANASDQ